MSFQNDYFYLSSPPPSLPPSLSLSLSLCLSPQPTQANFPGESPDLSSKEFPIPQSSWLALYSRGLSKLLALPLWLCMQYLGKRERERLRERERERERESESEYMYVLTCVCVTR